MSISSGSGRHAQGVAHETDAAGVEGLEELGEDAIIAQEFDAHLPQKRASVREDARSVVISDPAAAASSPHPASRTAQFKATMVLRDRKQLEKIRARPVEKRSRGLSPYVLAGFSIAAFVLGGIAAIVWSRGTAVESQAEPASQVSAAPTTTAPAIRPAPKPRGQGGGVRAAAASTVPELAPIPIESLPEQPPARVSIPHSRSVDGASSTKKPCWASSGRTTCPSPTTTTVN